jgi:hypothetical protein
MQTSTVSRPTPSGAEGAGSGQPGYHVVLRPLATPLPLGFTAQAVASFSLSTVQLQWIPAAQLHTVLWAVLALTVPLQALAAMMGFWARDAVAGTGMGLLAGGWATFAATSLQEPPGVTTQALGVVLLSLSVVLLIPAAAGLTKVVASLVIVVAAARFAATGVYELLPHSSWQTTAGWLGVALAATSVYAALAFELEAATGRVLLPVLRWGTARSAVSGDLHDQLSAVDTEPGVRGVL